MAKQGEAAARALHSGGEKEGCTGFNEMHSVNGHFLLRGARRKGVLAFFSLFSSPLCPLLRLPLLCIFCPPPQLARAFVRRQMIPQMPRFSRPIQPHSPASLQVRGHHRASEWVSVATVAMAVKGGKVFLCAWVINAALH